MNNHKQSSGFTIIEVLIVLAVAGLILVALLWALHALQRTIRNSHRRHDAQTIAASILQEMADSGGIYPAPPSLHGATRNANIYCSSTNPDCAFLSGIGLSYYTDDEVGVLYVAVPAFSSGFTVSNNAVDGIAVLVSFSCTPDSLSAGAVMPPNPHKVAVLYSLETANGTPQDFCLNASQ